MFTWQGITISGEKIESEGKGQTFAREHTLRSLIIEGPGVDFPFMIEVPLGAEPVIFERHSVSLTTGIDVPKEDNVLYFFGWEKDGSRHLWEFGGDKIILHEE
mgnify:CR=1 FL=1